MDKRLAKIRSLLANRHIDAILITTPATITYLTQFPLFSTTEREAYILITKTNQYIISSQLYKDELLRSAPQYRFLETSSSSAISVWHHIEVVIKKEHCHLLGFEENNLTAFEYGILQQQNVTLFSLSLSDIRSKKDAHEIEAIAKACALGDNAYSYILKHMHVGMTEKEAAFLLDTYIRKTGAEVAFRTIVAFGKNAAVPHHVCDATMLQKNDLILLDFGVRVDNYCSDMTRTLCIGNIPQEQKDAYATLLSAQEKALSFLAHHTPPIEAKTVDAEARNYLLEKGYPSFPHSLGHSIGIDVHDGFRLSPVSSTQLTSGMVFSIEPGIYIPGEFGMRIEDTVVLREKGLEILTKSPKEMIVL